MNGTSPRAPGTRTGSWLVADTYAGFPPVAFGVATLFSVLALVNGLTLPAQPGLVLSRYDVAVAAVFFALAWLAHRRRLPVAWTNPLVVACALLAASATYLSIVLLAAPGMAVHLLFIAVVMGIVVRSWGWLSLGLLLLYAPSAFLVFPRLPVADLNFFVQNLAIGIVIPLALHLYNLRTHARLSRALDQAEAAREALRAAERDLAQARRIEALGRLAGGVAHDFNNLLTPIISYVELALADLREHGRPASPEDLEEILAAGIRARDLTRGLLAFGRKQVLSVQVVDLNQAITNLDRMVRRLLRSNVELRYELAPDLARIAIDLSQLEQALVNLLANAQDALPRGGRVTITTSNCAPGQAPASVRHPVVRLAVSDTGLGMDQEVLQHLFEPFFTTKPHGRGTGLGLASVHGIIKQHGGEITVASTPGQGSVFTCYLPAVAPGASAAAGGHDAPPLAPDTAIAPPDPTASASAAGDQGPRATKPATAGQAEDRPDARSAPRAEQAPVILVAEDEPAVLRLVCRFLSDAGYRVLQAPDAEQALAQLEADRIDLVLSDIVMPGRSGLELRAEIQTRWPGLPVLLMTGYTAEPELLLGARGEPGPIIEKPLSLEALRAAIEQGLARGQAERQ